MIKSFLSLALAPALALLCWLAPLGFPPEVQKLMGVMILVVFWWLFSDFPLHISGIIGTVLAAVIGIAPLKTVLSGYSHPLIFLFMGGFIFAKALEIKSLDKRFALYFLGSKIVNSQTNRLIIGLLFLSYFLSMWLSNTATTAILLPISLGILAQLGFDSKVAKGCILLGVSYASSIGGITTPIGSTPNVLAIGLLKDNSSHSFDFISWMLKMAPLSFTLFIILTLIILSQLKDLKKTIDTSFIQDELDSLGALARDQKMIISIIGLTIFLWLIPGLSKIFFGLTHPVPLWFKDHLPEASVALLMSSLIFILPSANKDQKYLLSWKEGSQIDWGTLLLFGSGLSLGKLMFTTGMAKILGEQLIALTSNASPFLLMLVLVFATIFATELVSNTATANLLLPIIISSTKLLGLDSVAFSLAIATSCSLAFMFPVATPPNAIVYGSGLIELKQMARFGLIFNLLFCLIVTIYFSYIF